MSSWARLIGIPYDFIPVSSGVPNGTTTLGEECRGLLVQNPGKLVVKMQNGQTRTVYFITGLNPGLFGEVNDSTGISPAEDQASGVWEVR